MESGIDTISIGEKELKLLMNFLNDALEEIRTCEEIEKKNNQIDRVLGHIQQYLEIKKGSGYF